MNFPPLIGQKFSAKRFAPTANIRQFASRPGSDFPYSGGGQEREECDSRAQFVGVISSSISRHFLARTV